MQIYGSKFPISIAVEFRDFFYFLCQKFSKIGTESPRKWPIGDLFKNQNQGMWSTLGYTYGLILDQISECRVLSKL